MDNRGGRILNISELTLSQVQDLRILMPEFAVRVDMELTSTYEEFIDCLYSVLDNIISYLEENTVDRKNDSEDRLTIEIVGSLKQRGFAADHDTKIVGHVDICVRNRKGFSWLGESKIHSDYSWLLKGFNQLCTRYSNATPGHDQGGVIIFIRAKKTAAVIGEWKTRLEKSGVAENLSFESCPKRQELAFFTKHTHAGSGRTYKVRHMGVEMHFDPKDVV